MIIPRQKYLEKLIRYKDKDLIKVITGVRRCGKSVLLFDIYYDWLIKEGTPEDHIIKVNLENDVNGKLRNKVELLRYIESIKKDKNRYYVFIDEIQYIDSFEDLLNNLKNNNCDVYITGSNARMLSTDIATSLRGRSIEIKVYPLSFKEFYSASKQDKKEALYQYIRYGGFPYVALESDEQNKIEYTKMLESTVASKDIIDRYKLRNPTVFNEVYNFMCSNIGSAVSISKITNTLKSNGYKTLTNDTVGNYIEYLCESFLFYKVYRYDIKGRSYLKTLNKYYICDLGLRNARLNYRQIELTHSLENIIYLELIIRGYSVDIGKNSSKEIDFIAKSSTDTFYVQVAYSMPDKEKILQETSSFLGLDDGYKKIIITMDEDPFSLLENGYKKINAIDFLLNDTALEEI